MAIVFWEGHLLLFVRYMVIIFQSIKRLYLAQLAACTKVKESDSPPSLWSQRILMCRCSGRMAEGPRKELRGSERGRYSSPCVLSPGSLWSISVERKHSYTLHQSLPVSSRLNLPWPSAVPFVCSGVLFAPDLVRERPLCSFVWSYSMCRCCKHKTQNKARMSAVLRGQKSTNTMCTTNYTEMRRY